MKRPMRRLLLVVALPALALSACKGNCRQLSEKMCDCALNTVDKDSCLQRVASSEGVNPPTPADEAACAKLKDTCDCRLIDTPEGKVRCGLARPSAMIDAGI
jgi:hypothetical protein